MNITDDGDAERHLESEARSIRPGTTDPKDLRASRAAAATNTAVDEPTPEWNAATNLGHRGDRDAPDDDGAEPAPIARPRITRSQADTPAAAPTAQRGQVAEAIPTMPGM